MGQGTEGGGSQLMPPLLIKCWPGLSLLLPLPLLLALLLALLLLLMTSSHLQLTAAANYCRIAGVLLSEAAAAAPATATTTTL